MVMDGKDTWSGQQCFAEMCSTVVRWRHGEERGTPPRQELQCAYFVACVLEYQYSSSLVEVGER